MTFLNARPKNNSLLFSKLRFFLLTGAFLCVSLFSLGLPSSHCDDLFFIQTAKTYNEVGEFYNQSFTSEYLLGLPSNKNYFQFPFYFYLISVWISVFGLNIYAIQIFCLFFVFIGCFSVQAIGLHYGLKSFFSFWGFAIVALIGCQMGLRPEFPSIYLFFASWLLFLQGRFLSIFAAVGLLTLATTLYPTAVFFALPLIAFGGLILLFFRKFDYPFFLRHFLISSVLWFFLFFLLLYFFVAGELNSFFRTYILGAQLQNPGALFSPAKFSTLFSILFERSQFFPKYSFIIIPFLLFCWFFIFNKKTNYNFSYFFPSFILLVGLAINCGVAPLKVHLLLSIATLTVFWFVSAVVAQSKSKIFYFLGFFLCFYFSSLTLPVLTLGFLQKTPPHFNLAKPIAELQSRGYRILIDSNSARYGLGWDLPKNVFDFRTSRSFLNSNPKHRILPSNYESLFSDEVAILSWNESLILLSGQRMQTKIWSFYLPIPPTKSEVFFVSRKGIICSVFSFCPENFSLIKPFDK